MGTALLPDRKLCSLEQQPAISYTLYRKSFSKQLLLYFYFEECVKQRYSKFVKILRELTLNHVDYVKSKSLDIVYNLLVSKPEHESILLTLLVNKLGDPSRKIASKTRLFILRLLIEQPKMNLVVACEIEKFLCRLNIKERAIHNAVILLNQLTLSQ